MDLGSQPNVASTKTARAGILSIPKQCRIGKDKYLDPIFDPKY